MLRCLIKTLHFPENKIDVVCLMCLQILEQRHCDEVLLQLIISYASYYPHHPVYP